MSTEKVIKFSERLSALRKSLGLTREAMAKEMGITGHYIYLLESERRQPAETTYALLDAYERNLKLGNVSKTSRRESALKAIADLPKKGHMVRYTQEGKRLEDAPAIFGSKNPNVNAEVVKLKTQRVPVLGWSQAGVAQSWEDWPDEAHELIDVEVPSGHTAIAVKVRGDSMEPKYEEGDILVLLPEMMPTPGRLIVARFMDDGTVFKKFDRQDGELITLLSYNPAYPPLLMPTRGFKWMYPVYRVVKNVWDV